MSQAEDLLNSIQADNEISLYTSDPQTEGYIVVNSNRFITVPEELKRIAYPLPTSWAYFKGTKECPKGRGGIAIKEPAEDDLAGIL